MQLAMQHLKPKLAGKGPPWNRREEPTWHERQTLLKLSSILGASNDSQIQAALSYKTWVFADLPVFRNFFAHRNDETAKRARALASHYTVSSQLRPSEILCSVAPGRPQRVLADWLDDLRNVVDLLCQ
jgi:hypothetical protein